MSSQHTVSTAFLLIFSLQFKEGCQYFVFSYLARKEASFFPS